MNKFREMLDNDKVVLIVSVYTESDNAALTRIEFDVDDYYEGDDYIKLISKAGSELVLPINTCKLIDEEEEAWVFPYDDVEFYINKIN